MRNSDNRQSIDEFAGVARRYCEWAESPFGEPHEEMGIARELLAKLHSAIVDVELDDSGDETADLVTYEDWYSIMKRFQNLPVDLYWDVFDPLQEESPVLNTLSDDLSDIYRDLKEGLILYETGRVAEAVWQWRFDFDIHWGSHLTGAQRAIHSYFS